MYRIDDATAATSLPAPEAAGTEGYFTEGNPATGTPATKVRGSWLNMIQEELCGILAAAGIARSKTNYNQVNSALQKMYSPVVGAARNLVMSVTSASATATLTADQIIVATALNGQTFALSSFNKTINLATVGVGGMDTGSAPVSGYVALYAIFNPTTGASALLARNATSAVQPNVYGGGNMPSGYTASALVSVWPTNASGQFVIGLQFDREVGIATNTSFTTSAAQTSLTSFSVAGVIPPNARTCRGDFTVGTSSASGGANAVLCGTSVEVGRVASGGTSPTSNATFVSSFPHLPIVTPQTLYYRASVSAGTLNFTLGINAYTI